MNHVFSSLKHAVQFRRCILIRVLFCRPDTGVLHVFLHDEIYKRLQYAFKTVSPSS